MDIQLTNSQVIGFLAVASPVMIGWWVKTSLDKLDKINVLEHRINSLKETLVEIKGEMKTIIEMGKQMAVLDSKANTLFNKYDELSKRLEKINVQIQ